MHIVRTFKLRLRLRTTIGLGLIIVRLSTFIIDARSASSRLRERSCRDARGRSVLQFNADDGAFGERIIEICSDHKHISIE